MKVFALTTIFLSCFFSADPDLPPVVEEVKSVAETFVKVVDENDAEALRSILHPEMMQFVRLDGKLIPFRGGDFIQMVEAKKLGGESRTISHKSINLIRGETAEVILNAVSEQYDFMYQISMAKNGENWLIVGILVDIIKL